ncbi:unnamed protein product [Diamesa hyperborea]
MKINEDIKIERKNCTFDVEEFTRWYYQGDEKLEEKRFLENYFLSDPELEDKTPDSYLSHKEQYEGAIRKATIIFKKIRNLQEQGKDGVENYMALLGGMLGTSLIKQGNPLSVHFVMFLPALMGHGTGEQQAEWMDLAWNCKIIGTYAQTELGHGTFIRGLETTATYDASSEEFVLNSPTLTSYKWWPGGLGHTANYAIVIAQLYSKEKCHGVQPFIVKIRCDESHMPMPGIRIGEIGNKLNMNGVNNGFLAFKNVRIPRKNMLMKNAKVLANGDFVKPQSSKLTYGTMMFVRVVIIRDMSSYMTKAVTIATRYSTVRRQSPINPNEPEPKVLEHVTQQFKIFPILAKAIVIKLSAEYLWDMYNHVTAELDKGDLERLPELHSVACCLKAVCTNIAAESVEVCRRACGGHGYMQSSGFPDIYGMVTAAQTYEGENTVLLLQTSKYLIKIFNQILNGETNVPPTVSYLYNAFKCGKTRFEWEDSIVGIIKSFQMVSAGKIAIANTHLQERVKIGCLPETAANLTSIELASCSEAHCRVFLLQCGYEILEKTANSSSPELAAVFRQLIEIYAVDLCLKSLGDLLQFINITNKDIEKLQQRLECVLREIRINAVGIVDGFDIPDRVLCSVLGCYDGNIYERIFNDAKKSPLNQEDVNKSFDLYLKPFMKSNL